MRAAMKPAPNTKAGRKPVVDKMMLEERTASWLARHPTEEKELRAKIDAYVRMAWLGRDQMAAGKNVRLR